MKIILILTITLTIITLLFSGVAVGNENCYSLNNPKKNIEQAIKQCESKALEGDIESEEHLAAIFINTKRYSEAKKRLEILTEKRSNYGYHGLGLLYEHGWGVNKDYSAAKTWYEKADKNGYGDSTYNLGIFFLNGYGVDKDSNLAMILFKKAALKGNTNAAYNLGYAHEKGIGVDKNIEKARAWYLMAASKGDSGAKKALNRLK